jgi:hypothetical protein
MQGVISPLFLLNGIGSIFTRKGEGLIGFNYALNGPAKSPTVSVNPLSAFTPGMFRQIFRAPAPKGPVVEGPAPQGNVFEPEANNPATLTEEQIKAAERAERRRKDLEANHSGNDR